MRGMASILLAALLIGACGVLWWRCEGEPPAVDAPKAVEIGRTPKTVTVGVVDKRSGLREIAVAIRQGEKQTDLPAKAYEGGLATGGPAKGLETFELPLDARALGLKEGEATLEIAARDWSWRRWLAG